LENFHGRKNVRLGVNGNPALHILLPCVVLSACFYPSPATSLCHLPVSDVLPGSSIPVFCPLAPHFDSPFSYQVMSMLCLGCDIKMYDMAALFLMCWSYDLKSLIEAWWSYCTMELDRQVQLAMVWLGPKVIVWLKVLWLMSGFLSSWWPQ